MVKIIEYIKNFFSRALGLFWAFLKEAIPVAKAMILAELKDVAINTVTELSKTDLTNEEKRKSAFLKIKEYALKEGVSAKDSLINFLVELSVQYRKQF